MMNEGLLLNFTSLKVAVVLKSYPDTQWNWLADTCFETL